MSPTSRVFELFAANDNLFNIILIIVATTSVSWYIRIYVKSKTPETSPSLPPGPPGLPVVGNLPFLDPELHTYFQSLAKKYGPILKLRFGSKLTIVVTSPALAQEIYKDQDINFSNRDVPLTASALTYGGIDMICSSYGPEWRTIRKTCVVSLLSRYTLDSFYHLRQQEVRKRTRYLYEQAQEGLPVDIDYQMFLTVLNLIVNMLWGGSVKGDETTSLGIEFRQVIKEAMRLMGELNISDFLPWLARFDLQGYVKEMHKQAHKLDDIFNRVIEQSKKILDDGSGECKDFLQHLLKLKDEGDSENPITMNHIKALLMDLVIGSTHTSSNTVEFAMAELINNPKIMKRAQQELDQVVGKDNIVEESHIAELPYMLAVMKETLRLHPTFPLVGPRVPIDTTVVGGYLVPKGTTIFVNAWAMHRDPDIWENPLEFRPERFLDKAYDFRGNDHRFIPFGSGRRICAGVALAERMVLYTLATLLHSFDWKTPKGKVCDLKEKFGIVAMKLKNPLLAIPVPRLSNANLYQ